MMSSFTCCQGDILLWISGTVLYPPAEVQSGNNQALKIDLIVIIVIGFKLMFLTTLAKSSIVYIWRGPEYAWPVLIQAFN